MIETIVLNYLSQELTSVPCYMEAQDLDKYVLVEKTGSSIANHIKSATVVIQSYADTMYNAAALNEEVKEAMENIVELATVSSCKLNSDYNYTDTTKKKYRYQAVFDLVYFDDEE